MPDESTGTIHIEVNAGDIKIDTEMSQPELVFWLEVIKNMIVSEILANPPTE